MLLSTSTWTCLILAQVLCIAYTRSYIVERVEKLNGKSYVTRQDQPFFRVYHQPHFKVFRPPPGETGIENGEEEEGKQKEDLEQVTEKRKRKNKVHSIGLSSTPSNDNSVGRHPAKFGHHHLPKGEMKDTAEWPLQLRPYLTCMDLNCQCPLFGGSLYVSRNTRSGAFCALPSGKVVTKAIRKEYRTLTKVERINFITHMQVLKKNGLYNSLSLIHRKSGVHSGPGFFPWHREFIKRLEMVYRMTDPHMQGLPYWDSTLDNNLPNPADSIMFSEHLIGDSEKESGDITSGPFAYWETMDGRPTFQRLIGDQEDGELFNEARIDWVMNQTEVNRVLAFSLPLHSCINYTIDDRFLEFSHDYAHYFISGDMMERFSSSNDPLFMLHHAFIDLIWEMWRQKKQVGHPLSKRLHQILQTRRQREQDYPANNGECMPEWHFSYNYMSRLEPMRNIDALSNKYTDNLYEYAPRPSCKSGASAECSSEFLFCDTQSQPSNPVCSSMVKLGGNCQGFEWSSQVCYQGQCVQGKCIPSSADQLSDRIRKKGENGDRAGWNKRFM